MICVAEWLQEGNFHMPYFQTHSCVGSSSAWCAVTVALGVVNIMSIILDDELCCKLGPVSLFTSKIPALCMICHCKPTPPEYPGQFQ